MPRLSPAQLLRAGEIHHYLPLLLRTCRDVDSARNELRWLQEHALKLGSGSAGWRTQLRRMVQQRAKGTPLQYILGTEYFGDLEIACRPGVLIPRQDTASAVTHLVQQLQSSHSLPSELRILDLCTGTGCIPLLFEHLFQHSDAAPALHLLGVDISSKCVQLARHNKARCASTQTCFIQADVLAKPAVGSSSSDAAPSPPPPPPLPSTSPPSAPPLLPLLQIQNTPHWDILLSNPPYISPSAFIHSTARSVRSFEPKLALVPPSTTTTTTTPPTPSSADEAGDLFYPRLLSIANAVRAKVVLLEVADLAQAVRVAGMVRERGCWEGVEVWRDEPGAKAGDEVGRGREDEVEGVRMVGRGNGRSVVCWRGEGGRWLGRKGGM